MGISFKIDTEGGVVYAMAEGILGIEDVRSLRKNLLADPKFNPDFGVIIEFRLSNFRVSDSEGKILAAELPAGFVRKAALVHTAGPNREWALRYKEWARGKVLVEVFTDVGSAKKWVTSD